MRYAASDVEDAAVLKEFLTATSGMSARKAALMVRVDARCVFLWRAGQRSRLRRATRERLSAAVEHLRDQVPVRNWPAHKLAGRTRFEAAALQHSN